MPSNKVRTRFAPSPTGYMHVGRMGVWKQKKNLFVETARNH